MKSFSSFKIAPRIPVAHEFLARFSERVRGPPASHYRFQDFVPFPVLTDRIGSTPAPDDR